MAQITPNPQITPTSTPTPQPGQGTPTAQQVFDANNPAGTALGNLNKSPVLTPPPAPMPAPTPTIPAPTAPAPQPAPLPTAPKPTPAPTPTPTPTPTAPVDMNVRREQILANLNEGYKNDQGVQNAVNTGNFAQFQARYNVATPEEKKIVEDWYKAHAPSPKDSILNTFLSGGQPDPSLRGTPEYGQALKDFTTINQYALSNGQQLYDAVHNGMLVEGTPAWNQIAIKNPQALADYAKIKQDKTALAQINGQSSTYGNIINKGTTYDKGKSLNSQVTTPEETPNYVQSTSDKITANLNETEKLLLKKNIMNDPNIKQNSEDLINLQNQMKTLKDEEANLINSVRKQYAGTGATEDYINAAVRVKSEPLYQKMNALNNQITTKSQLLQMYTQSYQTNIANQLAAQEIELKKLTYLDQQEKEKRDLEQKFDYTYGDFTSSDPRVRKVAALRMAEEIQKQYSGIPFARTTDAMANDILASIESGKTTSQISSEIVSAIQAKPEYQAWAKAKGLITPAPTITTATGAAISPANIIQYSTQKRGRTNLQCGEFVNDYWESVTGNRIGVGDSLNSKIQALYNNGASKAPSVGSVFVMDTGTTYGHTGIVTQVNSDGSIEVLEANRSGSQAGGAPTTGHYSAATAKQMLFSAAPAGKPTTYSQTQINILDQLDPTKLTSADRETLKNNGLTDADLFNYKAAKKAAAPTPTPVAGGFNPAFAREYDTWIKDPSKIPSRYKTKEEQERFIAEANAYVAQKPTPEAPTEGYDPALSSYYLKGTSITKSEVEGLGKSYPQFIKEANAYIQDYGKQRYEPLGWTIRDPNLFSTLLASPQGKTLETQIPDKLSRINSMNGKFDDLITLVQKNGPEWFSITTSDSKKMAQKWTQIALDAKDALNLGVLNGPDLDLIKSQIPDPTSFWESMTSWDVSALIDRLKEARDSLNAQASQQLNSYGIMQGRTVKDKLKETEKASPKPTSGPVIYNPLPFTQ